MLACPFCGETNPDDATVCLNCQRDLPDRTMPHEAYRRSFMALAISLAIALALSLAVVLRPADFYMTRDIAIGLIAGFLVAGLLIMGLGIRAVVAISASRKLHRKHGVRPVPPGGVYLLPVISMLISAGLVALGLFLVVLVSIFCQWPDSAC